MSLLKVAGTTASSGTLYVDSVFSTWLYTGNGSTQTITNGIDLAGKGGLVWTKCRGAAVAGSLEDTTRGIPKRLVPSNTNAEVANGDITSYTSTGYTLGFIGGSDNVDGYDMVSWTFRKAAKFFDVVTYTGTGIFQNITHNLGSVPGMIIVKRTDDVAAWSVYHRSLGNGGNLYLNTNEAANVGNVSFWNNTSPTSSVFTVNNSGTTNASGGTYVAYLFAHDTSSTGIIQCGSYTGNGSATGPVVTLGWEPQYLMVRRASGTGNWQVIDSMRGMPVGSADATLQANLSNAESSVEYLSPTATGFQITSTSTEVNFNGSTYIYMAIRRPNKPPTTGTQVYTPVLYTGDGAATKNISTGKTYVTDWMMTMDRTNGPFGTVSGYNSPVITRLTGFGIDPPYLKTISSDAEYSSVVKITLNNSQYDYTVYGTSGNLNGAGLNYVDWNFRRAPGFFDVVCYTGNQTWIDKPHNLGVVPELIIAKNRNSTQEWVVWQPKVAPCPYWVLNTTAATATINADRTATTTTFSTMYDSNSFTYVAYLFATLAGISKVGSYTGNGTGQAIACGFSAGARFVLIKRTDSTGDWYTFDSARGLTSGSSPYLLLNTGPGEVTGNNGVYASTGGFTFGSTASTTTNINAATYIFLAVA